MRKSSHEKGYVILPRKKLSWSEWELLHNGPLRTLVVESGGLLQYWLSKALCTSHAYAFSVYSLATQNFKCHNSLTDALCMQTNTVTGKHPRDNESILVTNWFLSPPRENYECNGSCHFSTSSWYPIRVT